MLVGASNQEKALVGAFFVIVTTDGSFAALKTADLHDLTPHKPGWLHHGLVEVPEDHLVHALLQHGLLPPELGHGVAHVRDVELGLDHELDLEHVLHSAVLSLLAVTQVLCMLLKY